MSVTSSVVGAMLRMSHFVSDLENGIHCIDLLVRDLGDVKQPHHAVEVNEGTKWLNGPHHTLVHSPHLESISRRAITNNSNWQIELEGEHFDHLECINRHHSDKKVYQKEGALLFFWHVSIVMANV